MKKICLFWGKAAGAAFLIAIATMAHAEPGDAEAVANARRDYALAMKGHDAGLQNAMRAELTAQLAKFRERSKTKRQDGATQRPLAVVSAN